MDNRIPHVLPARQAPMPHLREGPLCRLQGPAFPPEWARPSHLCGFIRLRRSHRTWHSPGSRGDDGGSGLVPALSGTRPPPRRPVFAVGPAMNLRTLAATALIAAGLVAA